MCHVNTDNLFSRAGEVYYVIGHAKEGDSIMEPTAEERKMLIEKKEEIRRLTDDLVSLEKDPSKEEDIKKKLNGVLSLISTIAAYSPPKDKTVLFDIIVTKILTGMYMYHNPDAFSRKPYWVYVVTLIDLFCKYANLIQPDFTKKGRITINFPKIEKIEIPLFKTEMKQ